MQRFTVLESVLPGLVSGLAYGYGGYLAISGRITVGAVVAALQYINRGANSITSLTGLVSQAKPLEVHAEKILGVLRFPAEPRGQSNDWPEGLRIVRLEDVTFSYHQGRELILQGVSAEFVKGKTTAICGASEVGKTTLGLLLCGLIEPTSGRVLANNVPVTEANLRAYRHRVRMVTESESVFEGSVMDNLRLAVEDPTREEIDRALALSSADKFITRLPSGLNSSVRQGLDLLSSGQKQRLFLARAILADPDMVILDEATANLDLASENLLRERLRELSRSKIVILIAHRPSVFAWADRVLELKAGRLIPRGEEERQISS